jgi:hypothetical protein
VFLGVRGRGGSRSSQAFFAGVTPLGECYTTGSELRVTVGIEPEAIASPAETAEGVVGSLTSPSPSATGNESAASPSDNEQELNGVDSYNNTDALKKL